jgi:Sulfotransferase family
VSLTFIVNTARCGSTMVSRILNMHPEVLSISEFFSAITGNVTQWKEFPSRDMDGQEMWELISAPSPIKDGLALAGLRASEMVYPFETGRFNPATGVPTICNATLPMLTDDPDALFDQLAVRVPTWPRRPAGDQFRALFNTLAELLGRPVVVERSGASLPFVPVLRTLFPEARFVLQYRDGIDCALSMSRHVAGRFHGITREAARIAGLPPTASFQEVSAAAPEEFRGLITEPYDVERFMSYPVPIAFFGQTWTWMMVAGTEAIKQLPRDIWTTLQYEQLIATPREELTRLAEFIGVPATPEWLNEACSSTDSGRIGSATRGLDPETLAILQESCEPGTRAIQQLESEYGLLPRLRLWCGAAPVRARRSVRAGGADGAGGARVAAGGRPPPD